MAREKKSNMTKYILIFLIVIVVVPITILTLIYNTNNVFKEACNSYLRDAPGVIGDYFSKYPTTLEKKQKTNYVADYYINLDADIAADKMYIIKKEDEKLFYDIVQHMKEKSFHKTEQIITKVRNLELRSDLLISIYSDIEKEKEDDLNSEIKRLEKLNIELVLKEIESIYMSGEKQEKDKLICILNKLDEDKLSEIIWYVADEYKSDIFSRIDSSLKENLESLLRKKEIKIKELIDLANIYEVMDTNRAYKEIGNTDVFSYDELSYIYLNLSIEKSSDILYKCDDEEFIDDLFKSIRDKENLLEREESTVVKINEAMSFLKYYEENINNLVSVYQKMEPEDVANIVERMILNDDDVDYFGINTNKYYKITDSKIILDILRNMNKTNISKVLNYLDPRKTTEITRRLAM